MGVIPLPGERIALGGTLKRKCITRPKDDSWSLQWILPDGTKTGSELLTISNLQAKDAGRYTCLAKHKETGAAQIGAFILRLPTPQPSKLKVILSHHLF